MWRQEAEAGNSAEKTSAKLSHPARLSAVTYLEHGAGGGEGGRRSNFRLRHKFCPPPPSSKWSGVGEIILTL
jgi:hypothetical protein